MRPAGKVTMQVLEMQVLEMQISRMQLFPPKTLLQMPGIHLA
jgi:hypothetical protein